MLNEFETGSLVRIVVVLYALKERLYQLVRVNLLHQPGILSFFVSSQLISFSLLLHLFVSKFVFLNALLGEDAAWA